MNGIGNYFITGRGKFLADNNPLKNIVLFFVLNFTGSFPNLRIVDHGVGHLHGYLACRHLVGQSMPRGGQSVHWGDHLRHLVGHLGRLAGHPIHLGGHLRHLGGQPVQTLLVGGSSSPSLLALGSRPQTWLGQPGCRQGSHPPPCPEP